MNEADETNPVQPIDLTVSLRSEPGTSPGTLIIDPNAPKTSAVVHEYAPGHLDVAPWSESFADLASVLKRGHGVVWVDVVGLGDGAALQALGDVFGMHRLVLEDVVNVHQRPKCEEYGDRLFVVTRVPVGATDCATEQMSLFLGPGFLLTVRERSCESLELVRHRLRNASSRLRARGADYLAYAILDAATDAFFPVLEDLAERLEALESEALDSPSLETLVRIRSIKRELMAIRRTIWPLREVFNAMLRDTVPGIAEGTRHYLRDCYDHAVQLLDITDNYRELASGLMDVYLSSTGNRMNEIMKVLTIVSTVFIPLTFLAGIYGMNFDSSKSPWNMPELTWKFGYPLCLMAMLVAGLCMLLYFRRLGWIWSQKRGSSSA